jgi:hypothetical protein
MRAELLTWNIGAAATVLGTLTEQPAVTTLAAATMIAGLALFALRLGADASAPCWLRRAYLAWIVILGSSTVVGLVLAWTVT